MSANDLIDAFNAVLPRPATSHTAATPGSDLYELYLFGLCIKAAQRTGLTAAFVDSTGRSASNLTFRSSPSTIYSNANTFTHAILRDAGGQPRLEVHLGIYVTAQSGIPHEADVVILDAAEAERARALKVNPRVAKACVMLEAKFYSRNLPLGVGRGFLGLTVDCGERPLLLASTAGGPSTHRMLSHHGRGSHLEVGPTGPERETDLRSAITTLIRDYLARTS